MLEPQGQSRDQTPNGYSPRAGSAHYHSIGPFVVWEVRIAKICEWALF
ncbi:unnamed protein product [Haemonchus placei]|uniref:Uncharacterized protein n=1 Tax=Haemonchus placei TaxID=6290 RepID=A0A3P7T113_HAEPC|nr:unnamed protein product [Haemonchus placei]